MARARTIDELLTELGLARNEAKAYVTLLEGASPTGTTGYEVAARSGIPRSAIYAVLRKLEQAGAAFSVGQEPARFFPTDPARLVDEMRRRSNARLDELAKSLTRLPKRDRPEPVWTVSRYDEVMARIDTLVRSAERSVWLSLWPREIDLLAPALQAAAGRKLHRVMHAPDLPRREPDGFSCWFDETRGDPQKARWSHKALVVVDRRQALIGGTEPEADNHAVVTSNPSLVDVATNHIILDITLLSRRTGRDCAADVNPMMRPHLERAAKRSR